MSFLITGSTGFVGQRLCERVQEKVCVVREEQQLYSNIFKIDSLNSETCWEGAFRGVTAILHLAGLAHNKNASYEEYHQVNVEGTVKLAKEAANASVKRFVFISSIGVCGSNTCKVPFSSGQAPKPDSLYSRSKLQAEIELQSISKESGMELVIIRPPMVYGVDAPGNFNLLKMVVRVTPVLPFGITNNRRDFISVENLVDLIIECAVNPAAAGGLFLASDGDSVSTKDFTNAIAKGIGKKVVQLPIPPIFFKWFLSFLGKKAIYNQLFGDLEIDSSDLIEVLNWRPPFTMLQMMEKLNKRC